MKNMKVLLIKEYFCVILILNTISMSAQKTDPWTQYMTPSEIHKLLSGYTGPFSLEITMDGQEPITIDSKHEMILGGRFLTMAQKGTMMGMEYASLFTLGYNTIDHTLSMTTLTNMGTGTLYLTGKASEQDGAFALYGSLTNPVSKQEIKVRQTITFPDENTLLIESYDQEGDQPEKRTVTYRFIRK